MTQTRVRFPPAGEANIGEAVIVPEREETIQRAGNAGEIAVSIWHFKKWL